MKWPKKHQIAPCKPNPCKNSGQCVLAGNGFSCLCPPQFTGKFEKSKLLIKLNHSIDVWLKDLSVWAILFQVKVFFISLVLKTSS